MAIDGPGVRFKAAWSWIEVISYMEIMVNYRSSVLLQSSTERGYLMLDVLAGCCPAREGGASRCLWRWERVIIEETG